MLCSNTNLISILLHSNASMAIFSIFFSVKYRSYSVNGKDILSHIYRPCRREPLHTHLMETWSRREWPSKWWGAFIVIDKMGSWHPWAESVGLGEEIGMMKVFKCLFSWTATDSPLGLRPIGIGRVSAVYVFSCRQQRFLINHQTLVVYKPRGGTHKKIG